MIEVRPLTAHAELVEAVRLQKEIWGFQEIELLPVRLFVVATKVGGQVFGGFDGDRMIGFLLAIPGIKTDGVSYLHSHMMGVLAEYRNRGIGRMLKLLQRSEALERGVTLVEWTFDPLELKNAFFNIERLGAIVRRYVLNQYGTTSSHLHGGLPTDRCVAEWPLATARTTNIIDGRHVPEDVQARIEVPIDIAVLRKSEPAKARDIQKTVSDRFLEELDKGISVIGFERRDDAGVYLLGPWQSD
jgi:predicted GNAT superfamily acetyltransferase